MNENTTAARQRAQVRFFCFLAAIAAALSPCGVRGQTLGEPDWNHFGVDFRLGLNMKARFNHLGSFGGQPAPSLSGGVDHNYSDGFVRLDSSADRGGLTWNWGYQNASQASGNGTLLMHAASTDGASSAVNDDPRLGVELNYARDIGKVLSGRWGFKIALGFTDLKVRDSQPLAANVNLTTDAYSLGGITPPQAPYSGSFSGPGPLLGDTPTRTVATIPGGALITGSRQLDVWLYDFRFGPYLAIPLFDGFAIEAGGGLAVGLADSNFSFAETTTTAAGTGQGAGVGNRSGSMVGFYGEAALTYEFVPDASFFGGLQFQHLGEFNQSLDGRTAQLDLRDSVYFVIGVRLHF